eukprot:CAMPEP_0177691254 /NCGR_PEP_ID=MMETSP0484_2-20121128/1208_1 /TAXON_ID=354590 /ORGANISM="Rhodomonas lens, Strain RHODO" /LENGTH=62 /DNA_ID=CAMNT_0019201865 /DNA_START=415 /DNA_END=599 /DNA_ORIENTATION=+
MAAKILCEGGRESLVSGSEDPTSKRSLEARASTKTEYESGQGGQRARIADMMALQLESRQEP